MSQEPGNRQASAAEFGRELQLAQRHNGLTADPMALSEPGGHPEQTGGTQALPLSGLSGLPDPAGGGSAPRGGGSIPAGGATSATPPPDPGMFAHTASVSQSSLPWQVPPVPQGPQSGPVPTVPPPKQNRKRILIASAAAAAVLLLVVAGVFIVTSSRDTGGGGGPPPPRP